MGLYPGELKSGTTFALEPDWAYIWAGLYSGFYGITIPVNNKSLTVS